MTEKDMFMWMCLKKKILPTEWIHSGLIGADKFTFSTAVEYFPKLQQNNYVGSDAECHTFQPNVTFKFVVSGIEKSFENNCGSLQITTYYGGGTKDSEFIARLNEEWDEPKNEPEHTKCLANKCTTYIWCFDSCLIKMTFKSASDPDSSTVFTKRFHLECTKRDSSIPADRFPVFVEQQSISVDQFKSDVGYVYSPSVTTFVPVDIEIRARLYLVPLLFESVYPRLDPHVGNKNCSLGSTLFLSQEKSNQMQSISPFIARQSKLKTDVHFQLGSGSELAKLPAHSWILSAHSPVFRSMLSTEMTERTSGIIKLSGDVRLEVLELFLGLVYDVSGFNFGFQPKNDLPEGNVILGVLQLAHQYQIEDVFEFCLDNIIGLPDSKFDFQAAFDILKAGQLFEIKDLENRSAQWLKKQLRSAAAEQLRNQLKELLKQEKSEKIIDFVVEHLL